MLSRASSRALLTPWLSPYSHSASRILGSVASRPALPSRALIDSSKRPSASPSSTRQMARAGCSASRAPQDRSDAESVAYDWLRAAAPPLPSPHLHHSTPLSSLFHNPFAIPEIKKLTNSTRASRRIPALFPALLHSSLKSCHCGFIDSINAIFCGRKKKDRDSTRGTCRMTRNGLARGVTHCAKSAIIQNDSLPPSEASVMTPEMPL